MQNVFHKYLFNCITLLMVHLLVRLYNLHFRYDTYGDEYPNTQNQAPNYALEKVTDVSPFRKIKHAIKTGK